MTSSLFLGLLGHLRRNSCRLLPLATLLSAETGAPTVIRLSMAPMLVENLKLKLDSNPNKAEFSGLMTEHKWLASLSGVTSTTMKFAGTIVFLVAIVALGGASCLALTRPKPGIVCVVRSVDRIEQMIVSNSDVVLRRHQSLLVDSSIEEREMYDEIEDPARIFREMFPADGNTHSRINHDQNHDAHLIGSQFGVDGLPNVRAGTERPSLLYSSVTPPSESSGVVFTTSAFTKSRCWSRASLVLSLNMP